MTTPRSGSTTTWPAAYLGPDAPVILSVETASKWRFA